MMELTEIGVVESAFREKADPFVMRKKESRIVIKDAYAEGLYRLAESAYIQVVYGFHLSTGYALKGPVYTGETRGVFASRSPNRPSPLGVTTVKLQSLENNILKVAGLDAVHGSPVFDIKPHAPVFDEPETDSVKKGEHYAHPRSRMIRLIKTGDLDACLLLAGTLHGHFCPGLATGVYAAVTGMQKMAAYTSDGMERLLAITETNSCFCDGIQAVTGCTLGNNALSYHDIGKTAVTFARRGNKTGIRIRMRPEFHDILSAKYPDFSRLFEKVVKERAGNEEELAAFKIKGREAGFGLLALPFDALFECREIPVEIPAYAPIFNSVICAVCGEQIMEAKAVKKDEEILCRPCSGKGFQSLTGKGID